MTRELPILATASVALALRTGRQTQDRRPKRDQRQPYPWRPGDLLYVRETTIIAPPGWGDFPNARDNEGHGRVVQYLASHPDRDAANDYGFTKATPSLHMPKWAARTWLRVLDVRPERLQDITEEDAGAEGVRSDIAALGALSHIQGADAVRSVPSRLLSARDHFRDLWHSLYGAESWKANPWVWRTVLELDRERSGLNEKAVAHG